MINTKNIFLKFGLTTLSCAAVLGCFSFLIPSLINLDLFKDSLLQNIENQTGFKVSCEKIELIRHFSPSLNVHLYHTGILYPDNNKFLQIKDAYINIKLIPLLFKKIEIKSAKLQRPIIYISLYKDFSTSLEKFINNNRLSDVSGFSIINSIPLISSDNYKIKFFDESLNKTFYLEGKSLCLSNLKINNSVNININGSIFEDKKEYIKYDLNIFTALNNKHQRFSFSPFKSIKNSNIKGSISGHLKTDFQNNIHGNLNISNLSLNISDVKSIGNNINLIFNGNNAQFNALIHTSEKDSAKITGIFNFGKKHFIDINTAANNVNLNNLFKIINEISVILNLKNPLRNFDVSGLLNADFNLKSDFKKIESKGKAEIYNASFAHNAFQYPVSNINAVINLNNNEIKIEKAIAIINKTPIKAEGCIKTDLTANLKAYSDNLDLKTILLTFLPDKKFPINIKNGMISFESEITGNFGKNLTAKSFINLKNLNFIQTSSKIPVNIKNCLINLTADEKQYNGNAKFINTNFVYKKKSAEFPELKFDFNNKYINLKKTNAFFFNSPFEIEGTLTNYKNSPNGIFSFSGNLDSNTIASFISDFIKLPYKAVGKLNTKGIIQFENQKIKLNTKINSDKNNYISYLVIHELLNKNSYSNINIEFDKNLLTIKDISVSDEKESKIKIFGQIETGKELILKNLNFLIPNAITVASDFFGGEELSFKSDLILNNNFKNPSIKGSVKIIKYNLKKYLTSIKNADIKFSPENIKISAPNITVNDSLFNITANIIPDLKNIIVSNIQLNSLNLDINSLYEIIRELRTIKQFITIQHGSAAINNFKIENLKARDIISDFTINNNILKISNINANAYNGLIKGNADYDIKNGFLDIDMQGKNLNIKNALFDLCGLDDNISGITDVNAKISLLTGSINTVLKTLSGYFDFNARNGSMGTLGKFEYYLYAQNLLYHGLINTTLNRIVQTIKHENTNHYNFADGKVIFQNGYIVSDNIHTQGENMSLFINGKHNLMTNKTNITIFGRISDEITKKLGSFGEVSISDIVNGKKTTKENFILVVPKSEIDEIMPLFKKQNSNTNTFKVNVLGNIKALNSINSFTWITAKNIDNKNFEEEQNFNLPDFSDL